MSEVSKDAPQGSLKDYLTSREFLITIVALTGGCLLLLLLFFFVFLPWITHHSQSVEVPDVTYRAGTKKLIKFEQAEELLKDVGLSPMISDSQYDPEFPVHTIIRQEPAGLDLVKPGRTVYLVVSKKNPPNVKMPNILETNLDQAKYFLENWGLKVGEIKYKTGNEAGLILKAYYKGKEIKPNEPLPKGSTLDLDISQGAGSFKIPLPNLIDKDLAEAYSILNNSGLGVGNVRYKKLATDERDGRVISQYPRPDRQDSVNINTTVDLEVAGEAPTEITEGVGTKPSKKVDKTNPKSNKNKADEKKRKSTQTE